MHCGLNQTLFEYCNLAWIPNLSPSLKVILQEYVTCKRARTVILCLPNAQQLQVTQVNLKRLFKSVGVDNTSCFVIILPMEKGGRYTGTYARSYMQPLESYT